MNETVCSASLIFLLATRRNHPCDQQSLFDAFPRFSRASSVPSTCHSPLPKSSIAAELRSDRSMEPDSKWSRWKTAFVHGRLPFRPLSMPHRLRALRSFFSNGVAARVNTPSSMSANPVRYFDGIALVNATDLSSDAFGKEWGQDRSWSNDPSYSVGSDMGNGWVSSQQPQLLLDGSQLILITDATTAYYFDGQGNNGNHYGGTLGSACNGGYSVSTIEIKPNGFYPTFNVVTQDFPNNGFPAAPDPITPTNTIKP